MRLPLSLSLLLAPALLAQRFPEIEPNDTAGTAQPIVVGTQIDANLIAPEQDWFSFGLPAAARIRIHTSNADTRIALLDAAGTTYLGFDDDARGFANGWSSDLTMNVAAGNYTIQVTAGNGTVSGPYSLEVAAITPAIYDGAEIEPNDQHLTATSTGLLGNGRKRFLGNLGPNTLVASLTADVPVTPPVVLTSAVAPSAPVFTGTVVAAAVASTTTVTQTNPLQPAANPLLASYTPMSLTFTSGVNIGLARLISSNTAFSITTTAFPAAASPGDTYTISTTNSTMVTWVPSLALASLYVGSSPLFIGSGYNMRMTSGANIGLSRLISANTGPAVFGSAITTAVSAWPVTNAVGDTFEIDCIGSTTAIRTATPLVANTWNPTTGLLVYSASLGHYQVRFTSGANLGLVRQITGNTAASITLSMELTAAPASGDTFVVEQVDYDYWQIVLTAPTTGIWFQINEGDAPAVFGHRYELYDSTGNALLPVESLQLPAFGTQAATSATWAARSSSVRVWPAGTYYLAVRNQPPPIVAPTTMPWGVLPVGNYMLEIFTMPMDTGAIVTEAEPAGGPNSNNTAATATPLAPGDIGRGNVTFSTGTDSTDWWGPFAITGPTTITYQTRRRDTATPNLDTTVTLWDAAHNWMSGSTNGNILDVPSISPGSHGRATVSFPPSFLPYGYGNVYIEVSSPGITAGQSGDYELEVSLIIAMPYVTASYSTTPANQTCGIAPFPRLWDQFPSEVPAIGATFSRQLTGTPPNSAFLFFQGLSNTLGYGVTPLPYDLTSLFAPGCTVNVDPAGVFGGMTDAAGAAELSFNVPGNVGFRGFSWFEQAMVLRPAANPLGVQLSNYGRTIFGERSF